jgi:hypothetical protein
MAGLTVRPAATLSPRKGLLFIDWRYYRFRAGVWFYYPMAFLIKLKLTYWSMQHHIKNKWMTFPPFSIPFNGKVLVNSIIFLNLGLALILLDRTVLRPLFQKRAAVGY